MSSESMSELKFNKRSTISTIPLLQAQCNGVMKSFTKYIYIWLIHSLFCLHSRSRTQDKGCHEDMKRPSLCHSPLETQTTLEHFPFQKALMRISFYSWPTTTIISVIIFRLSLNPRFFCQSFTSSGLRFSLTISLIVFLKISLICTEDLF